MVLATLHTAALYRFSGHREGTNRCASRPRTKLARAADFSMVKLKKPVQDYSFPRFSLHYRVLQGTHF